MKDNTPWILIEEIQPHPRNPKTHTPEQIQEIADIITEVGWGRSLVISIDNYILVGEGAYLAARDILKEKTVPYRRVKHKHDSPQAIALMIADNKLAEKSGWKYPELDALSIDLELAEFDVSITGFDHIELNQIKTELYDEKEVLEDNFIPDDPVIEAKTQPGDLWTLKNHRLLCGDATITDDIGILMDGRLADLIITDPPYNVDYTGGTPNHLKIQNDKQDDESFYQFLLDAHKNMYNHVKDGASIYEFHADTESVNFRKAFMESGFKLAQCCIWTKQSMVMGRQDYHWQHEPILYGWKPTGRHQWYGDRKQSTLWNFKKPLKNRGHPTMKPIRLIAYPIKNSSLVKDVILDPFGGSGSTLIAAEQLQRTCHTMELDPHYCDVIINRWEEFTGQEAEIKN